MRAQRRIAATFACALLLAGAAVLDAQGGASPLSGDSWATSRRVHRGKLVVAYYYPLEGFAYADPSGKLSGLLVDMMDQFTSYLKNVQGVNVELEVVRYADFGRFYQDVKNGKGGVFGLAGTTITEGRKKEVSFGPPFFSNRPVLVTNEAVPDIASRAEIASRLAGFHALAFKGTTLEALVRKLQKESLPGVQVEALTSHTDIIDRVSRDPKAFTYLDLNIFWVARKNGAKIKRQRIGDEPREDFGIFMPLSCDWKQPLDEFFAAGGGYRRSRSYRSLVIKHLGVDLEELLAVDDGR